MPKEAAGATAVVVENPFTDPVTVAWSKLDARRERLAESGPEIERLKGKVARLKQDVVDAQEAVQVALALKADRADEVEDAKAELAAAEAANPEDAAAVKARRKSEQNQRMTELQTELDKLKGKN